MTDYAPLQSRLTGMAPEEAVAVCMAELPSLWMDDYESWVVDSNVHRIEIGSHFALFDFTSEFGPGAEGEPEIQEDRIVAMFGRSTAPQEPRDASRMRGYIDQTGLIYGEGYDKGHFIAHSMGGDDLDAINWFPQETRLNRGWSEEGKLYRSLEAYCARMPGTFFFSRPLYEGMSVWPSILEVGLLRDGALEIHRFDNRSPHGAPQSTAPVAAESPAPRADFKPALKKG